MLDNLLNIESLLAVSVGAIFSFKISKINLNVRSEIRKQSPDIKGDNNVVIYNQAMTDVRKEMAFSVKLCTVAIVISFHIFPSFFVQLLLSLSFLLPLFCAFGVANTIRINGINRSSDLLYLMASTVMGVFCYCSSQMLAKHLALYPTLLQLFEHAFGYGLMAFFHAQYAVFSIAFIVISSIACASLIVLSFYLSFAYTTARNANDAFRYSIYILLSGYLAYLFSSGVFFSLEQSDLNYFKAVLFYPFSKIISLLY
ncbi:Uncharacterised protein [Yersinia frederiksenii]|nr:Uncharacterised protein [Yersinia frederiksenii]CNI02398.1 Uncharacterised protein [Yersinia frederiksenii]